MEETTGSRISNMAKLCESLQHTLSNQAVQVLVVGALDTQVASADVVDGLVIDHEAAVGVLQGGVGCEDRVVWLDHGGGDLRGRVNAELQLALLAIIHGQTLHQQGAKSGTCSTAERVENEETLQTRAVVGDTSNLIQDLVDKLLANGVVTTSIVVRGIFLSGDHVLGVEQRAVGAGADLVDDIGLQVGVDGTGDIFALACVTRVSEWFFLSTPCGDLPVSEKKVLKPWSSSAALRSSVR